MSRLITAASGRIPLAHPAANRPAGSPPPKSSELRVPPEEYAFNLRLMIREARSHGVRPILLTSPRGVRKVEFVESASYRPFLEPPGYASLEEIFAIHDRYNVILARVAREGRSPVDLDGAFAARGRGRFFGPTEILHPDEEGHRLTARLVLAELVRLGIVRRPGGSLERPAPAGQRHGSARTAPRRRVPHPDRKVAS
jgi:hypothetical protein